MLQPKVKTVQPLPDYKLLLEYENGEKRALMLHRTFRGLGTGN